MCPYARVDAVPDVEAHAPAAVSQGARPRHVTQLVPRHDRGAVIAPLPEPSLINSHYVS
ncbi:hypothetical protein JYU34_022178 [Plutella xylostella]|uniref:Uncharacterized protein n=1 Tax=Plutella xylostella TaxID=51655 RepID=A0ABQ7PU80_PLUXY|nr:hypothetical protein JYU34_022178 [Plutella xylostella]